ncbi:hypothetical protein SAMN05660742_10221 [Propionispira arboris]|uniref:Uncharacterized protein n=1 Tax=Propionispira arboris TaxID=84035 RepID=A0A1H6UQG6_9FIRM|nr:hypothetical protein [Propionispira arboris]SEI94458.1 hypothetical protein SAMN05660742_10221 [Propionispira arboris]
MNKRYQSVKQYTQLEQFCMYASTVKMGAAQLKEFLKNENSENKLENIKRIKGFFDDTNRFYTTFYTLINQLIVSCKYLKHTDFRLYNYKNVIYNMEEFIRGYNAMHSFFKENGLVLADIVVFSRFFSTKKYDNSAFLSIGISVATNGELLLDPEKVQSALLKDGHILHILLGRTGVSNQILNTTVQIRNESDRFLLAMPKEIWQKHVGQPMTGAILNLSA